MILKKKIFVENQYSGSNWNFEKTTKYIFELNGVEIEAGYFEHYRDKSFVKSVLELPQSYGCPTKCSFCASSAIDSFIPLDDTSMEEIFLYMYEDNHLSDRQYVLLTMTGMGDPFFCFENIKRFLLRIKGFKNLHFTLSSCLWNTELLYKAERLGDQVSIRNIQITYVTEDRKNAEKIIPFYNNHRYDFSEVIQYIKSSKKNYYRINYIVIKGVNDDEASYYDLCEKLKEISDKTVVRISKLNETGATKRNGLLPAEMAVLFKFQHISEEKGLKSYVFYAHENDNMNCGQLITEK